MMPVVIIVVLVIIVLIAGPLIIAYTGNVVDQGRQDKQDRKDAETFGETPKIGDVVCDLAIIFRGEMDFDRTKEGFDEFFNEFGPPGFSQSEFTVYIGEGTFFPQIAEYKWVNCYTAGTASLVPLFSMYSQFVYDAQQMALFTLNENFELKMEGVSESTNRLLVDGNNNKVWKERIDSFHTVDNAFIEIDVDSVDRDDLPIRWKVDFFLHNVKVDDYKLEITAISRSINDMGISEPIYYDVIGPKFQ